MPHDGESIGQLQVKSPTNFSGYLNRPDATAEAFDAEGALIEGLTNDRVASVKLDAPAQRLVVGVSMGELKVKAIAAALKGKWLSGLITDERTAERLIG